MPTVVLTQAELAFLVAARRAILGTTSPTGRPRLVPVCFIVDTTGPNIQLLTPLDDKSKSVDDPRALARVRDIAARPAVSLLVEHWDEDWTRLGWLRLEGTAALIEPPDVPDGTATALRAKYPLYATHNLESSPAIAIDIERATSWGRLDLARLVDWTPDPDDPAVGAPYVMTSDGSTRRGTSFTGDTIELPIAGREVSVVGVSRSLPFLRLDLFGSADSSTNFTLQIDGPFRMAAKEGVRTIDPESGPDPAYLRLVEKTIARATASVDGSLELAFADGDRLLVAPSEYEPWQLNGEDGTLIVSVAGGGLAVWHAQPARTE